LIAVNEQRVQILDFANDLNIISESLKGALGLTTTLEKDAPKVGLRINVKKMLVLLDRQPFQDGLNSIAFEKVE